MTRRIAVYGKGGIGKSTISSNLTAALSEKGVKVLQIGCDPKHDSTRLLTGNESCRTVLEYMKEVKPDDRRLGDVVLQGFKGSLCAEAGGPEPGVGCAGRGIITAFDLLNNLGVDSLDYDLTLYDVLGDVVCGGFAVPIRNGYADTIYIVTSGEFMSIYAANNILKGVSNYDPDRIGGIIFNSRGDDYEVERVETFSEAVGIPIIARIERSKLFLTAEKKSRTIIEEYPDSEMADTFRKLAEDVLEGRRYRAKFLSETELEKKILGMDRSVTTARRERVKIEASSKPAVYSSKSMKEKGILHGCAFSGAVNACLSVSGLCTILHATRNCSQFAFQLTSGVVKRAYRNNSIPSEASLRPDVVCTSLDEDSMIFSGNDRLRSYLEDAVNSGRKDIAVITSCAPGIIGDDVGSIIQEFRDSYPGVRIAYLQEDGNLNGDHMQGLIDACQMIVKEFAIRDAPKKDIVNIVGIKPMASNLQSNLRLIEELLGRMGIGIGCRVLGNCSIKDIDAIASAKLSLLITEDQFALQQKTFLMDDLKLEFSENAIGTGMRSTERWLREVGKYFGKDAEGIITEQRSRYDVRLKSIRGFFEGKTVYVTTLHNSTDWISELIDDLGMKALGKVVVQRADHFFDQVSENGDGFTRISSDRLEEVKEDILRKDPDFLFTMYPMDIKDDVRQFKIPIVPDIGPMGALDMMERFIRETKRPRTEGWKKDVL